MAVAVPLRHALPANWVGALQRGGERSLPGWNPWLPKASGCFSCAPHCHTVVALERWTPRPVAAREARLRPSYAYVALARRRLLWYAEAEGVNHDSHSPVMV